MIKNRIFLALLLLASMVGMAAMGCSAQPSGEAAEEDQVTLVLYFAVNEGDELAYADLGSETVENHSGGSLGDKISVSSIIHTLTELPGITAVQLMLEGEIVEAVFGHIATGKPLTR